MKLNEADSIYRVQVREALLYVSVFHRGENFPEQPHKLYDLNKLSWKLRKSSSMWWNFLIKEFWWISSVQRKRAKFTWFNFSVSFFFILSALRLWCLNRKLMWRKISHQEEEETKAEAKAEFKLPIHLFHFSIMMYLDERKKRVSILTRCLVYLSPLGYYGARWEDDEMVIGNMLSISIFFCFSLIHSHR